MSTKIQKVISYIVITEKNEKLCQTTEIPGCQGAFSDKVTPNIDGFSDEPVSSRSCSSCRIYFYR